MTTTNQSTTTPNPYTKQGYLNRKDYLRGLADDFGIPYRVVAMLANALGENEDFDGLICELEDYADMYGE